MGTLRAIHARVPGRIRYAVPALYGNPKLAREVELRIRALPGVHVVRAAARTGTLLVLHDAREQRASWEQIVTDCVAQRERMRDDTVRASSRLVTNHSTGWCQPLDSSTQDGERWHLLGADQLRELLSVDTERGLGAGEAAQRAERGRNELPPPPRRSELGIFLGQLTNTPVAMLAASAVLSAATGGLADALAILSVLGVNACIGYATESGAERAIESLTRTPGQRVAVLRDGRTHEVALGNVVLGDVLLLRAGLFVAADARVVEATDLTIDESSLTGESMPVHKHAEVLDDASAPLAERVNMVYRGTLVTGGSGRALVVAVGASSEIGRIQALASQVVQSATPMQRQLDALGRQLALGASAACVATMAVGLLRGQALLPMFRTAISLGVAAVPEGLPTVAISTLALGLSRMREERVIVRQLAAVETLGSVQVVCLDKTGTLTANRMTAVALEVGMELYRLRQGQLEREGGGPAASPRDLEQLLRLSILCSEVELEERAGVCVLKGTPTESALVQLALDRGLSVNQLRSAFPLLDIQRRAQARNYMTTLHAAGERKLLAVKGRPAEVLALCARYLRDGERHLLDERERARIETHNDRMAGRALRVLGFAFLEVEDGLASRGELPPALVWVGLVGMEDPPREGLGEVLAQFHRAGLRTVMITGDQSATAQAVGRQVGLSEHGGHLEIVDSTRLDRIEAPVLEALARRADVFARVSPAHKLQIVRALQASGLVVAMTGDGVNDGPALKAADIGIAMGGAGASSAARELAHVVLEDDDIHGLVLAIEQGRTIYDDIRKAVRFILATNLSEILYTFTCVSTGLGEPLTPMQLLWINLLTDVFPELALAVEPPELDVLARPPRDPARPMFTRAELWRIGAEGTVITLAALGAQLSTLATGASGAHARSVGFVALTFAQLLHAFSARSETATIFDQRRAAHNRWLWAAVGGTGALQLSASFVPGLRRLLGTAPLGKASFVGSLTAAAVPFLVNESSKLLRRSNGALTEQALVLLESGTGARR